MALSEDQLCQLFADTVRDSPEFANWLLSKTKFVSSVGSRLLHKEQASIRPRKHWWRHWWCHVPELAKDRETDIFMVFETSVDNSRFALHIECKKDSYRFNDGQAAAYAPRAKHMLAKPQFLDHSDFTTILLAPKSFEARYPQDAGLFDEFIAFESVADFIPAFATDPIGQPTDAERFPERRASRTDDAATAGTSSPDPKEHAPLITRSSTDDGAFMTDLPDLFPGFATREIDTPDGRIFARVGGHGAPLLLLHGYPQTHAEWHRIAPRLAERFTVVAMDLRGYGASFRPEGHDGEGMTKRAMGRDAVAVMAALGFERFRLVGHDRGGRVAYRLAFDQPERLDKVSVIDIIPTASMFHGLNKAKSAMKAYHWLFLAQPTPFPETLIDNSAMAFLEHTLASWSGTKDLSAFDPAALAHYRAAFDAPRIRTSCEDYRAGVGADRQQDEADLRAGHKIAVPMQAIWGEAGIPASGIAPLDVWREYARDVEGVQVTSGHFVPEENPEACLEALMGFLR